MPRSSGRAFAARIATARVATALATAALVTATGAAFALSTTASASVTTQLRTARDNLANCQLLAAHATGATLARARDCASDQQAIIALLTTPAPTVRPPTTAPPTTAPPTTAPPTTAPPTTAPPTITPPTITPPTRTPTPTVVPTVPPTPVNAYPERWSVGAPGLGRYRQSDARLPIPTGYTVLKPNGAASDSPYVYNLYECGKIVLDHVYIQAFLYLGTECAGSVSITNSIIAPPPGTDQRAILVNSNQTLSLSISDTTIRPEPVGRGATNAALTDHAINGCDRCTITLTRVDVANTGGMCLCGERLKIERSWLHDNYIAHLADPSRAHTGGVFMYGGAGPVEISHSRLEPGVDAFTGGEVANYWMAITAVLFLQGGTLRNGCHVHDNFISLGAFGAAFEIGTQLRFTNNVFGPSHWGDTSSNGVATFAQWTNNVKGSIDGTPTHTLVPRP